VFAEITRVLDSIAPNDFSSRTRNKRRDIFERIGRHKNSAKNMSSNDNDDGKKEKTKPATMTSSSSSSSKKRKSYFSRSLSDSVGAASLNDNKNNDDSRFGQKKNNAHFFANLRDINVLFQNESRDVRRFVHRGNKVGKEIDGEEQSVVNKVGRVLEVGVRESSLREGRDGEKIRFERKELTRRRSSTSTSSSSSVRNRREDDNVVLPAFSFVSHEAKEFGRLRRAFGLSEEEYLKSFKGLNGVDEKEDRKTSLRVIGRADAGGRSGAWFFCTEDTRFLLKTTKTSEKKVLLKHLRKYTEHVEKHGRNTFLPQIYGCYSIKIGKGRGAYKTFLVIGYWFATQMKVGSPRYDLKGSRCKRTAREDPTKEIELLKDNNFVAHEERDCVRTLRREKIVESLQRDADFLCSLGLIDYSLLLGHHNMRSDSDLPALAEKNNNNNNNNNSSTTKKKTFVKSASMFGRVEKRGEEKKSENHAPTRMNTAKPRGTSENTEASSSLSSSGNEPALVGDEQRVNQLRFARTPTGVAFFGIVDVLTEWTTFKWFEWFFKSALFCGKRDVSCQPPKKYAKRFKMFMEEHVFKDRP